MTQHALKLSDTYPEGFDPDDYKEALEVSEFTPEEIEMLQALWHIMATFVDLGWNVDSVQMALPELFNAGTSDSVNPANDNQRKGVHYE